MAAETTKPIEQMEDKLRAGVDDFTAGCRDSVSALLASSQAAINGCQTMNGVLLAFMQSRAKESLETARRLAECSSPQGAVEIQLDYAREALQAYADHFSRCGALAGEALNASVLPLQRRAAAVLPNVPELAA
jgi:hypothetical protein